MQYIYRKRIYIQTIIHTSQNNKFCLTIELLKISESAKAAL